MADKARGPINEAAPTRLYMRMTTYTLAVYHAKGCPIHFDQPKGAPTMSTSIVPAKNPTTVPRKATGVISKRL